MTTKSLKYHVFRENSNLNMQNYFIFFDTETYVTELVNDENGDLLEEKQELKLGVALYWNRLTGEKEYLYFNHPLDFWDFVENKNIGELTIFAHNTDFDFKQVDGYKSFIIDRKYTVSNLSIENKIFIMELNKKINDKEYKIHIYDTFNYIQSSLDEIGKALKFPKTEIDIEKSKNDYNWKRKEVSEYCKNDVEITYKFIKSLISFLEEFDLSKLQCTSASLAFNSFRHKFYKRSYNPIHIHACLPAIKLERDSYRGGITDCFKIGTITEPQIKLDINSMYPHKMRNYKLPTQLLYYLHKGNFLKDKMIEEIKNNKCVIADCKIFLPENKAYILSRFEINKEEKTGFLHGEYNIVLTLPEIEYVLKYGKILKVNRLAVYKQDILFKEYVDFFYTKRLEFKKSGNSIYELFCKQMLNSLYGKFAQKQSSYEILHIDKQEYIAQYHVIEAEKEYNVLRLGNTLIKIEKTDESSFDAFVAISSSITAYARMDLIEMIEKAGRKNIAYCDTDSLIINESAIDNIKEFIDYGDKKILGLLKIEGKSVKTKLIRPKYYEFDGELKCKGVKTKGKNKAITLEENDNFWKIKQLHFEKFKTSLRKHHIKTQHLNMVTKEISKKYDKGKIHDGIVHPYHISDIKLIS